MNDETIVKIIMGKDFLVPNYFVGIRSDDAFITYELNESYPPYPAANLNKESTLSLISFLQTALLNHKANDRIPKYAVGDRVWIIDSENQIKTLIVEEIKDGVLGYSYLADGWLVYEKDCFGSHEYLCKFLIDFWVSKRGDE
ncbi:hypothetical protein UFOVP855_27 [uncultured Caudovirales phage]|jgi:hypothetical protein|uniref:Uncharacterized protein n=1 Tax=uncultured Caudovirales phage TaxID=2100421 RepID=A0A6J5P8L4_9CAUD|nr:hypothetical protein UFOVP527_4 [uncultured Caudovirales phage]CAB4167547.1 hypothetical protein UFOVP855_27 [uncultured Caudovirales phage]CAB4173606.1 hypothetical protein UFOVP954_47 [uncultured Caudovirales phage]CAB4178932.1 hypothetical protein UFOVP1026_14 [uncultured Caudovirales phage]CAB4188690.1 hypothetical protein UFOVP1180_51 [uncultured Caudovirales phage]